MKVIDVIKLLEENKNEKYIQKHIDESGGRLKSFGLGMTATKKIAKQIGKNHQLAIELWEESYIETKLISTMIDEPKKVDNKQLEKQMLEADYWIISHSLSNNLISKYKNINELIENWFNSKNNNLRRGAYLLIYEISKKDKNASIIKYKKYLDDIEKNIQSEENFTKDAMNNALIMIGSKTKDLNEYALKIADSIGKIEVDYGDNSCMALDAKKHLLSKRIQDKLISAG